MEIAPNIHQIRDSIVNVYLIIGDDGLTLIDAGLRSGARSILRQIKRVGYAPSDVRRILITHCDGDHVGGVAALKAMTTAKVYAHPVEALAMAIGSPSREIDKATLTGRLFRMFSFMFRFQPAQADVLLEQNEATELPGGIQSILTVGHTPGHVSYYLPAARVLFGGDSLMVEGGKLVASHGPNTWDQKKADESARIQAALGAQVVCLGHGFIAQQASDKFSL